MNESPARLLMVEHRSAAGPKAQDATHVVDSLEGGEEGDEV